MASDRLADLLVPNLIDRFDAIPSDQPLGIHVTKGELAYLIKSQYLLHAGLSSLLKAIDPAMFNPDTERALQASIVNLSEAQSAMNAAAQALIERTVVGAESHP